MERNERLNMGLEKHKLLGKWWVREEILEQKLNRKAEELEVEHQVQIRHLRRANMFLNDEMKLRYRMAERREFQLTKKLEDQKSIQQEQCSHLREEIYFMHAEVDRVMELYEVSQSLLEDKQHLQAEISELNNRLSSTVEQLHLIQTEKESLQEDVQRMEKERHKEMIGEMVPSQLKTDPKQLATEKEEILSKLVALEKQRKHDFAERQADRRDLEAAIRTNSKLSDKNMSLAQQLKVVNGKLQAEKTKHQLELQQVKKEHQEEVSGHDNPLPMYYVDGETADSDVDGSAETAWFTTCELYSQGAVFALFSPDVSLCTHEAYRGSHWQGFCWQ